MCLSFIIFLAYLFSTFGLECDDKQISDCDSQFSSNYTIILNVSSDVLVHDDGVNYVLAKKSVTLTATPHINNNASDFIIQSQFYYNFLCRVEDSKWTSIKCSNESTVVTSWEVGDIECKVKMLTPNRTVLACNTTMIQIAVNASARSCIHVDINEENHYMNKSAYAVGSIIIFNTTIFQNPDEYYFLYYSFGDNTSENVKNNKSVITDHCNHNYTDVCSKCECAVTFIDFIFGYPYYCTYQRSIDVIKPVTVDNSHASVPGKLYKEHPAELEMSSDATPPLSMCWHLYDPTEEHNVTSCPLSKNFNTSNCHNTTSLKTTISFASTGSYMLMVTFDNNASCLQRNYTLDVDSAVPVTADAVAGGVAGIVVACVVVAILIISTLGFIQYRRYKNRHIETAKFNFVVLPPINSDSRWARFKMACRRRWYKFTGRKIQEGLVPTLDSSGHYTYSDSYSSTMSYGALLQSEHDGSYEDSQVKVLHDYVSSGFHGDDKDDREL